MKGLTFAPARAGIGTGGLDCRAVLYFGFTSHTESRQLWQVLMRVRAQERCRLLWEAAQSTVILSAGKAINEAGVSDKKSCQAWTFHRLSLLGRRGWRLRTRPSTYVVHLGWLKAAASGTLVKAETVQKSDVKGGAGTAGLSCEEALKTMKPYQVPGAYRFH